MLKVRAQKLGGVAVLCLQGRIINGETEELSDAVRSQINASAIILDFAQVELIDAKGLSVLYLNKGGITCPGTKKSLKR